MNGITSNGGVGRKVGKSEIVGGSGMDVYLGWQYILKPVMRLIECDVNG